MSSFQYKADGKFYKLNNIEHMANTKKKKNTKKPVNNEKKIKELEENNKELEEKIKEIEENNGSTGNSVINTKMILKSVKWKVPSGVKKIQVEMVGGGGAGATVKPQPPNTYMSGGGGGGGGGYIRAILSVNPNDELDISVGEGGKSDYQVSNNSGTNLAGKDGTDTIIKYKTTTTITAKGGKGAPASFAPTIYSAGGLGGGSTISPSNDSALTVWGGDGHPGLIGKTKASTDINNTIDYWTAGGNGGSSYFGGGGRGGTVMTGGTVTEVLNSNEVYKKNSLEIPYGAGGGGGAQGPIQFMGGASGADGVVIITYIN
jgi:hypothetical protein